VSGRYHDLLPHEIAFDDRDLLCWIPRASHSRVQAHHRFWRDLRNADWDVPWTRIRVVARHVRFNPQYHPDAGEYVECGPDEPGATPVWRCETTVWSRGVVLA